MAGVWGRSAGTRAKMLPSELTHLSVREAGALLAGGEVSSVELTRAALDRIAAVDDRTRAFVTVTEELERMRDQMSNILEHFDVLQQVDTEGVEPTAHSADVVSVMRDDEVRASASKEDVLANAPRREDDFLRVRAVLE